MFTIRDRPRARWPEVSIQTAYGSHTLWVEDERRVRACGRFSLPSGVFDGKVLLVDYGQGFEAARETGSVEFFAPTGRTVSVSRETRIDIIGAVAGVVAQLRKEQGHLFGEARVAARWNRLRDIEERLRTESARTAVLLDAWNELLPVVDEDERARRAIALVAEGLLAGSFKHALSAFRCVRPKDDPCTRGGPPCRHCRLVGRLARVLEEVRRRMPPEVS